MSHCSAPLFALVLALLTFTPVQAADRVDFNRDVRPILSNHCWSCHGFDEHGRKAGLRLDLRESATAVLESGLAAVVPGKPGESELIARIDDTDPTAIMPPPGFKRPLTAAQKDVLRRWVAQGAEFAGHWAYTPPVRGAVPVVKNNAWARGDLDRHVLARLEREGVAPSPEADRGTWLRRVSLDLTGLPPSPAELDAFLTDQSPTAHEKVVDRLLQSPAYAERMTQQWLDLARYADTNGYNNDEMRTMWPWRDWVLRAFAEGMPYDRFLTEQLAGDLLPEATLSQKVATGFVRNHVLTTEGGIIEEEYHIEYVADRVHTVTTVFLAMSLQCARCHDHKYDPLTQKDFYRFSAFFNNVPDKIVPYNKGSYMSEPLVKVPSAEQSAELTALGAKRGDHEARLAKRPAECEADLAAWQAALTQEQIAGFGSPARVARFLCDEADGTETANVDDTSKGKFVGDVKRAESRAGRALVLNGAGHVDCGQIGAFEGDQGFTLAAWVNPASAEPSTVLSKQDEAAAHRGYDLILEGGKVACHVAHHWPDKGFKVITKQALPLHEWRHVAVVYTGTRDASGLTVYVDGQPWPVDISMNNKVDGTLKTDKPFHIGRRQSSAPFRGMLDDVQLFSSALSPDDLAIVIAGKDLPGLAELLAIAPAQRTPEQVAAIREFFLRRVDPVSKALREEIAALPAKVQAIESAIPVVMVMAESQPRRQTFLLKRGQYDQRADEVTAGIPGALPSPGGEAVDSRLALAKWLTRPDHPLTARVAVNRWWEMLFGTGLVETSEDFGIQGSYPSHPELLDWLATELVAKNWDMRAILKEIVLSATYRQSSKVRPDLTDLDPANRLLARGPRFRLPAEMVRDSALFHAGLLSPKFGGPSVKPYQPEGLWEDVSVERREKYQPDPGDGIYRRSLYTFWKRTCPPPTMSTFDAPEREFCLVRRARTNTPLQALALLNDPTYVEAARKLAERVWTSSPDDAARIRELTRVVLARDPSPVERETLVATLSRAREKYAKQPEGAGKLLSVGRAPAAANIPSAELAAWSVVSGVVLNLSEAVTKP
jgi:hypothetical protein